MIRYSTHFEKRPEKSGDCYDLVQLMFLMYFCNEVSLFCKLACWSAVLGLKVTTSFAATKELSHTRAVSSLFPWNNMTSSLLEVF